ncbi:MAG: endonuclease/exonuclease/phosphatase family protein [bacterium]|nr:endonuclease/exonuclease/phosphatase family protein [bacterium]
MTHTLRVCTLNIWNYNDPWIRRRQLIVDTIREWQPDVIGFQEIRHSGSKNDGNKNQAQQLAQTLGDYTYIYQPAQRNPEKDEWEGLAIFSRLPIVGSSFVNLSLDPTDARDNHQRIVLHAQLNGPAGSFHFFNTHLSLSEQGRIRTTREITDYVAQYAGDLPSVLVGDFNDTPDRMSIRHITGDAGLCDVWDHLNPDNPGWTFSSENAYVRQRNHDTRKAHRIDYIFAQPRSGETGRMITCKRIADTADPDGLFPSDHFGLIADIALGDAV